VPVEAVTNSNQGGPPKKETGNGNDQVQRREADEVDT
jgi:hypothetical protein